MILPINAQNIIPIVEKVNFKERKSMVVRHTINVPTIKNYLGGTFLIDRSATSDLFNYKLLDRAVGNGNLLGRDNKYYFFNAPVIQINNDAKYAYHSPGLSSSEYLKNEHAHFVHNTQFNRPKFKDISTLVVGANTMSADNYSQSDLGAIWRKAILMESEKMPTEYKADFEQVYRFDSIAVVEDKNTQTFSNEDNLLLEYPRDSIELKYSHIYVVPSKPTRSGVNNVLATIYYSKDDGVDHKWYQDIEIESNKITTGSQDSYKTIFQTDIDRTNTLEISNSTSRESIPFKIGEIRFNDFIYFDYAKQKIVKGFGHDSKRGLMVPYNLEGFYNRNINLDLNSVFKNVNLNLSTFYDQPFLNPSNGQVRLKIKEDNTEDIDLPKNMFDKDDIKLIRADKIKSLIGFERLNEK